MRKEKGMRWVKVEETSGCEATRISPKGRLRYKKSTGSYRWNWTGIICLFAVSGSYWSKPFKSLAVYRTVGAA